MITSIRCPSCGFPVIARQDVIDRLIRVLRQRDLDDRTSRWYAETTERRSNTPVEEV